MGTTRTGRRTTSFVDAGDFLAVDDFRAEAGGVDEERPSPEEVEGTQLRLIHPGAGDEPQLVEIRMAPGLRVEPHAHAVDEIFYVVQGEMSFGRRRCVAGTSIAIPAGTLYAFVVGPEGVQFLNFRQRADASYISRGRHAAGA